ncbi:hypothetical protein AVEN_131179-1 [Araneus ventricosus]|uniref:Tc1-like transposase DDE domain-containing protein n=1 Tax=Araneus ventricosus TaxID=182803 RepID=A0A4Y2MLQ7_ARAVE|nr:hypothetical protein AVEN_131179-1 [Araneus ventricosus]
MDGNARPHRANIVDECLQSEDITRMDWPAYSPDLNPIEHVTSQILEVLPSSQWNHIPSKENAADIDSRNIDPVLLPKNNLWWSGPEWLQFDRENLLQRKDLEEEGEPPTRSEQKSH